MSAIELQEHLVDQAWGYAQNIIDGDTFVMVVTSVRRGNAYSLREVERVRLRDVYAPELHEPGGRAARERLCRRLAGRRIQITVHARDVYGRALATISTRT